MTGRHQGRVAVVTGAAMGIGRAYACRLAAEGAHVVAADLLPSTETLAAINSAGGAAIGVICDVGRPDAVVELAERANAAFGRCDILVNNAGIFPVQDFDAMTFEDWRRVMAVNLDSQFLTAKAFAPGMRARKWGRIINQASDTVALVLSGFAHYTASKLGVIGLTRALASEFGDDGVTVNAIAPGLVRTPGTVSRTDGPSSEAEADEFAVVASRQAIRRTLTPDDLTGTLSFLASDDAAMITGQTFYVDGGRVRT